MMSFDGESKPKFRNSSYYTFLNASILLLWFKWSRYLFVGNDFEFFDIILFNTTRLTSLFGLKAFIHSFISLFIIFLNCNDL